MGFLRENWLGLQEEGVDKMINLFGDAIEEDVVHEGLKRPPVPKLFDYLASINNTKVDLQTTAFSETIGADTDLRGYEPFIINKGLSQSIGTIGFANLMNRMAHIPKAQQYTFLRLGIPKNRSFAKWAKEEKFDNLKEVMEKLGCSKEKAKEAILVLGEDGITQMLTQKGGIQKKVRKKK